MNNNVVVRVNDYNSTINYGFMSVLFCRSDLVCLSFSRHVRCIVNYFLIEMPLGAQEHKRGSHGDNRLLTPVICRSTLF